MRACLVIGFLLVSIGGSAQKKGEELIDSLSRLLSTTQKEQTRERASTLNRLGKTYLNKGDYMHALSCITECLALADKFNDQELAADCYRNISVLDFHQHNYEKVEEYDLKAMEALKKTNNLPKKAALLKDMGDDKLQMGDSLKATQYYNEALPIFQQLGDKRNEAGVYSNQSILCGGNYQKRIELELAAKKIWDQERTDNELPAVNTGNLGVAYLDLVRYDTLHLVKPSAIIPAGRKERLILAEKYLRTAVLMSDSANDVENSSYYTGVLAELDEQKGDFRNAYYNFRKYQGVTDSIFSQENKNKLAGLESQRTIDLKNKEIENKELQIGNQHKKMWLLAVCMAFLAAIGIFMYRQALTRKRTNTILLKLNDELDEANKIKARFFGILSHDLRSPVASLINFLTLQKRKPGILSGQEISDRENKITDSAQALLETMDAMLLWSKGQMEYFSPSISAVPVKELFAYLEKMFAGADGIDLTFSGAENLVVQTDRNYLQVIMQNLTANAVKALKDRPVGEIAWKAWQEQGNTYLSITDNGPGVREEQLKALYDETASSGAEHGLGLHIIRDLAKAIGSRVTFQVGVKSGASFLLSI
jgi:signal transduction histidine kinase